MYRVTIEKFKNQSQSGYQNYDTIYVQVIEEIDLFLIIKAINLFYISQDIPSIVVPKEKK